MPRTQVKRGIDEAAAASFIAKNSHPLKNTADLDPLMDRIGDERIVMLGEASHGTHEYYTWRSQITKRLIEEKGFNFIAVEGDWPDCYRLNRFIKDYVAGQDIMKVLKAFNRWPTWMWGNWEMVALGKWLFEHNSEQNRQHKVGFYGLDVYSLWESLEAVVKYLEKNDPHALKSARKAFECFEPYRGEEGFRYASALRLVPDICERDVMKMLVDLRQRLPLYDSDHENVFSVEQNALIAVNAEKYYRAMLEGGASSWNARDSHMQQTLERLFDFHGPNSKAIVWAHNTHIGDASATDMVDSGTYNIGQLAREHFGRSEVVLVGFGSYEGTVIAGAEWGAEMQRIKVPEGKSQSWEYLLHRAGPENKLLLMNDFKNEMFSNHIEHRAIGVVYNPSVERYGNYVPSVLPERYDAFLYIDKTSALHPLHIKPAGELTPETFPFGV